MKKSLIALAALAVVSAASAQTAGLTISGYVDRGYTDVNSTNSINSSKTVASSAGTTSLFFKGTEDIGGGNVVGFSVETDWADNGGSSQTSTYKANQVGGFANGESFISLGNAQIGTLKLGTPNSFMLANATGIAAPSLSTGVGSAYSSSFAIFNGIGTGSKDNANVAILNGTVTNGAGSAGARDIRISNTIQYVSPMFSGFSAGLAYAQQNNNVTAQTSNNAQTGTALSGASGNTVGMTEIALNYANGPAKVAFDTIQYKVGSNGTAQTNALTSVSSTTSSTAIALLTAGGASNVLVGGLTSTHNLLAGSYAVLPELTLNVGFGSFSSSNNASKGNSQQVGATYVIGAIDLMAQYAKVNDTSSSNVDRKMFGLGANYNLSKTARVYFRYDDLNYTSNATTVVAGSEVKRTAVGISKSF